MTAAARSYFRKATGNAARVEEDCRDQNQCGAVIHLGRQPGGERVEGCLRHPNHRDAFLLQAIQLSSSAVKLTGGGD